MKQVFNYGSVKKNVLIILEDVRWEDVSQKNAIDNFCGTLHKWKNSRLLTKNLTSEIYLSIIIAVSVVYFALLNVFM